jgi:hypothetical protein
MEVDERVNFDMTVTPKTGDVGCLRVCHRMENENPDLVGDNNYVNIIKHEFGLRYIRSSCLATSITDGGKLKIISVEDMFRAYFEKHKPKRVLEIGTFRGLSTALMAHYADEVITVDNQLRYEPIPLWHFSGIIDKITYFVTPTEEMKYSLINSMDFDFAFIDGNHDYKYVKSDFESAKRCGKVLFHDYYKEGMMPNYQGPRIVLEETKDGSFTPDMPFAFWEKNGR